MKGEPKKGSTDKYYMNNSTILHLVALATFTNMLHFLHTHVWEQYYMKFIRVKYWCMFVCHTVRLVSWLHKHSACWFTGLFSFIQCVMLHLEPTGKILTCRTWITQHFWSIYQVLLPQQITYMYSVFISLVLRHSNAGRDNKDVNFVLRYEELRI